MEVPSRSEGTRGKIGLAGRRGVGFVQQIHVIGSEAPVLIDSMLVSIKCHSSLQRRLIRSGNGATEGTNIPPKQANVTVRLVPWPLRSTCYPPRENKHNQRAAVSCTAVDCGLSSSHKGGSGHAVATGRKSNMVWRDDNLNTTGSDTLLDFAAVPGARSAPPISPFFPWLY